MKQPPTPTEPSTAWVEAAHRATASLNAPTAARLRQYWPLANAYSHFAARFLLPSRQDQVRASTALAQLGSQTDMLHNCLRLAGRPDAEAAYDSAAQRFTTEYIVECVQAMKRKIASSGSPRTPEFRLLCQKPTLELVGLLELHAKWLIYVHLDPSPDSVQHFRQLRGNTRSGTEETTTRTGLQGILHPSPSDAEVQSFQAVFTRLLGLWAIDALPSPLCFCAPGGFHYDWLDPDRILRTAGEGGGEIIRGRKEARSPSASILLPFAKNSGLPATFFDAVRPDTTLTRAIAFLLKDPSDTSDPSAMHGSHLCHHRFCLVHVVWESALANLDRKNCYIYALESRRYGQGLPVHCRRHPKNPCLLQIAQLTQDECICIQVNRLRAARGLAQQAFSKPPDHPFDDFVTAWPPPASMTRG